MKSDLLMKGDPQTSGDNTNWRWELDADGLAWLTFDRADKSANSLSPAILRELHGVLDEIRAAQPKGLILQSGKANGFIAGADIEHFTTIQDSSEAINFVKLGQETVQKIAAMPGVKIAAIHGFCLGGGLELALACDYRVVADEGSKLGLPEVMLGIYPGWWGIPNLARAVGAPSALDMILTGRLIDGVRAKRMGLADVAVPLRHLRGAARQTALQAPRKRQLPLMTRMMSWAPLRGTVANKARAQVAKRARREHYPAPYAVIDLWQNYGGDPLALPSGHYGTAPALIAGGTAKSLIRCFFLQERLKGMPGEMAAKRHEAATDPAASAGSQPSGPAVAARHVHVVGAGVMGGDIAAWCALRGLTVTLQDREARAIAPAVQRAHALFLGKLKDPRKVRNAMDRLIPDPAGWGAAHADVIIEAIFENLDAKQQLFKTLEARAKPDAILASNTSSIPLEDIATVLQDPSRLVGLHFFNPVPKMQLVEIVTGKQTQPGIATRAAAFARQIDRLPLPVKSSPGFLVNRVLAPYLMEAMLLVSEGVPASILDEIALTFGMPMGPIELADTIGLDICRHVGETLSALRPMETPAELQGLLDAKHLGKKSGQGFYQWNEAGTPAKPPIPPGYTVPGDLEQRLILPMLNECIACVREGIVADDDLCDAGIIFGTGFAPFRGGPMAHGNTVGWAQLTQQLEQLRQRYGERFKPDIGWQTRSS